MKFSTQAKANARQLKKWNLLCGWCQVENLKKFSFLTSEIDIGLPFAVSLAFPLNPLVILSLDKFPSKIYQHHYREVNAKLDAMALELANDIQISGYNAIPIPASVAIAPLKGHLSHRMVGYLGGLGWLGKSGLLITPEYKAMIRLVTLLTDLPLPIGEKPLPSQCGVCCKCLEVCPVKAIKEDAKDFNRKLCYKYFQSLVEREIVEDLICGLCIKVCEGGKSP